MAERGIFKPLGPLGEELSAAEAEERSSAAARSAGRGPSMGADGESRYESVRRVLDQLSALSVSIVESLPVVQYSLLVLCRYFVEISTSRGAIFSGLSDVTEMVGGAASLIKKGLHFADLSI